MKYKKEVSAGGIVYKKEGRNVFWLMTQHSGHKGWGFPKGVIGDKIAKELKEEAALREVKEEGGIVAKILSNQPVEVKYKFRFKDFLVDKTVYYFLMEYVSGDIENHDWEVMDSKFVTEEEVRETLTYKTDKEAFEKVLDLFHKQHDD